LREQWENQRLPRVPPIPGSAAPGPSIKGNFTDVTIPGSIVASVVNLLDEHDSGRERSADNPFLFFEVCAPDNKQRRELMAPMVQRWQKMQVIFKANAHENGARDLLKYADEVTREFGLFEEILSSLATGFYEQMERLDEILDKANI
jgi:hypothetical protein